jgi:hypothetical protein
MATVPTLDAEQTEKVTAFLAEAIKEFLETNYEESDRLSEKSIKLDLTDHGKDYATTQFYESELYKTEFFPQLYKDISISELPAEQIDEEEAFDEMLAELYEAALERVSWHIGLVVSIEGKD